MNAKTLHIVMFVLVIVGAVNWGLFGLLGLNVVSMLLGGDSSILTKLVYVLVGLSGVVLFLNHKKECMVCSGKRK